MHALFRVATVFAGAAAAILFRPADAQAQSSSPTGANQLAETNASVVTLHFAPSSVAASADGKWIAMLDPVSGEIYVYDDAGKVGSSSFRKTKISFGGGSIAFKTHAKRQWLVVGTLGDGMLRVIDPDTLDVAQRSVQVSGLEAGLAPVPDPASPLVYFSPGGSGPKATLAAFDVTTGKIVEFVGGDHRLSGRYNLAASADGRMVYARQPNTMPSGHRAIEVVSPAAGQPASTLRMVFSEHKNVSPYRVHLTTGSVLAGNIAYSPDLQTTVGEIEQEGRPLAFAPDRATLLTENGAVLRAISTNTWKQQSAAWHPLVKKEQRPRQGPENWAWRGGHLSDTHPTPAVFARRGAGWVALLVREDQAALVDLDSWGVPKEPVLTTKAPRFVSAKAGQALEIDVAPVGKDITVKPDQLPAGAVLAGNVLRWTPGDADVGRTRLTLRLESGTIARVQTVTVEVRQPSLALPFVPTKWSVSPDGKTLAILGPRSRGASGHSVQGVELAICDLAGGKIGATRVLESNMAGIATDGTRVFLVSEAQSQVVVLNASDLEQAGSVPLQQPAHNVTISGQGELLVESRSGASLVFDLPTLAPREQPGRLTSFRHTITDLGRDLNSAWSPLGGGLVLARGRVLDQRAQPAKPVLLTQELDVEKPFPNSLWGRAPGHGMGGSEPLARLPAPWGIYLRRNTHLLRADGSTLADLNIHNNPIEGTSILSSSVLGSVPAAVVLRQLRTHALGGGGSARSRIDLVVHDLIAGERITTLVLSDEQRSGGLSDNSWAHEQVARIVETATGLLIVAGEQVYTLPFERLPLAKLPEPFRFVLTQDRLDLPADRTTKVSIPSRSGNGKLRYELTCQSKNVQIDPGTGEVSVDGKKLTEEFVGELTQHALRAAGFRMPDENTLGRIRARVASLTGVQTTGVPMLLTFRVTARDEKQAVAAIEHSYIVDLPRAAFEKQVAHIEAEQKKAAAAAAAARAAQPAAAASHADGDVAALRQRIAELERRNAELEGQVKLLRELLAKPAAAP
jgi:hypothetical protein